MSRAVDSKHVLDFTGGLVDSGNEFNAPTNALKEVLNVEVYKDGTLATRPGLYPDTGTTFVLQNYPTGPTNSRRTGVVRWRNSVDTITEASKELVLLYAGKDINVYDTTLGGAEYPMTSSFVSHKALASGSSHVRAAEHGGRLFLCNEESLPQLWERTSSSITATTITPKRRDYEGADEPATWTNELQPGVSYLMPLTGPGWTNSVAVGDTIQGATSGFTARALNSVSVGSINLLHTFNLNQGSYFLDGEVINNITAGNVAGTCQYATVSTGLSPEHYYNLLNQGWTEDKIELYARHVHTIKGVRVYPSNAQVWTAGKDTAGNFSAAELDKVDFGNTRAPTGKMLLDIHNPVRSITDPISGGTVVVSSDSVKPGFSDIVSYAGRLVFIGGSAHKDKSGTIYFSKELTGTVYVQGDGFLFTQCYSFNDPTAEYLNETYPTDGGSIVIPDGGLIKRGIVLANQLLLFSDRGVWLLGGSGLGEGFTAQSFTLSKLPTPPLKDEGGSVVMDEKRQTVYYYSQEGFVAISLDNGIQIDRISSGKLDVFLSTKLPPSFETAADQQAREDSWVVDTSIDGYYDDRTDSIEWFYGVVSDYDLQSGTAVPYQLKLRSIKCSIVTKGFYPMNYKSGTATFGAYYAPMGIISKQGKPLLALLHNSGNTTYSTTWAEYSTDVTYDWNESVSGEFQAFFETWPDHLGQPTLEKTVDAFQPFFRKTEKYWIDDGGGSPTLDYPSGCQVLAKWDWSDQYANLWTEPQQAYELLNAGISGGIGEPVKNGTSVVHQRMEMQGTGYSVSFRFDKEAGKRFHFLGMSINYSMVTEV